MIISRIAVSARGNEVTLTEETGAQLTVSLPDFNTLPLRLENNPPFEIDGALESRLALLDEKLRAVKYAAYLLGFGDKSEKALLRKLTGKGFSEEACMLAAQTLRNAALLDDAALCRRKMLAMAKGKRYGPRRLRQEMYQKGFDGRVIDQTLCEIEIDFEKNAAELFEKFRAGADLSDRKARKRISDKLLRYGYDYDCVRSCFEERADSDFN